MAKKVPIDTDTLFAKQSTGIDPESFVQDVQSLLQDKWEMTSDTGKIVEWRKADGALMLRATVSSANKHRINWELIINAIQKQENDTVVQVGYASVVLRPGDLFHGNSLDVLLKDAVAAGEAEHARWSDALAEARRHISELCEQ